MQSDKKAMCSSRSQECNSLKKRRFSGVMKSIRKPKGKPADKEMVFVSYLVEKEISGHLETRSARPTKKPK